MRPESNGAPHAWSIASADGRTIPAYRWTDSDSPVALLVIHGLGDHGRALPYRFLADALSDRYTIFSFDHAGHGPAAKRFGSATEWAVLRGDAAAVAEAVKTQFSPARLVAVGLSMGALLALDAALEWPEVFDGVVAAASPLSAPRTSALTLAAARFLRRTLPALRLSTGIPAEDISRDATARDQYVGDPLFHSRVTARLAVEIVDVMARTRQRLTTLRAPALFMHGTADRITPWDPSLFPSPASPQMCRLYEGAMHNLFIEANRADVFRAMDDWMRSTFSAAASSRTA